VLWIRQFYSLFVSGVEDVVCDLDSQTITVKHGNSVSDDSMLEALQKWGTAAGKTVSLK